MDNSVKFTYNEETNSLIITDNGSTKVFKLGDYKNKKLLKYIIKAIDVLDGVTQNLEKIAEISFDACFDKSAGRLCQIKNLSVSPEGFCNLENGQGDNIEEEFDGDFKGIFYTDWWQIPNESDIFKDLVISVTIDGVTYSGKPLKLSEDPSSGFIAYIFGHAHDTRKSELEDGGLLEEYNKQGWDDYPFFFNSLEYDPSLSVESRNSVELYLIDFYDAQTESVTKSVTITFSRPIE